MFWIGLLLSLVAVPLFLILVIKDERYYAKIIYISLIYTFIISTIVAGEDAFGYFFPSNLTTTLLLISPLFIFVGFFYAWLTGPYEVRKGLTIVGGCVLLGMLFIILLGTLLKFI